MCSIQMPLDSRFGRQQGSQSRQISNSRSFDWELFPVSKMKSGWDWFLASTLNHPMHMHMYNICMHTLKWKKEKRLNQRHCLCNSVNSAELKMTFKVMINQVNCKANEAEGWIMLSVFVWNWTDGTVFTAHVWQVSGCRKPSELQDTLDCSPHS